MFWEDDNKEPQRYVVPADVVDVAFAITCRCLPVDHAYALQQALRAALPWLDTETSVGVHSIHVAESGNGWMRPDNAQDLLYLSRRTKLILRLPQHRIQDAMRLTGQHLVVAGNDMTVGASSVRPLSAHGAIFARYLITDDDGDEARFLQSVMQELKTLGIRPKKMLCGMEKVIRTPERAVHTRSLMLADMDVEDSVKLQQHGLGPLRQLGCGLFLPHKDIKEVGQKQE
jgi:CRISPR-associated protein Cas6